MFSGIIEQIAKIDKFINTNKDSHIILELDLSNVKLNLGDSVAINGVCLQFQIWKISFADSIFRQRL